MIGDPRRQGGKMGPGGMMVGPPGGMISGPPGSMMGVYNSMPPIGAAQVSLPENRFD